MDYDNREDWGDIKKYEINIKKTTADMTSYDVMALPPTDLSTEIAEAFAEADVDLELLFDGKDPFKKED